MNWQPAVTAPKTGEHILVSVVGRGNFGICGGKEQDFAAVVHWWPRVGEEGFYLSSGYPHHEEDETPINFTHWCALAASAGEETPANDAEIERLSLAAQAGYDAAEDMLGTIEECWRSAVRAALAARPSGAVPAQEQDAPLPPSPREPGTPPERETPARETPETPR